MKNKFFYILQEELLDNIQDNEEVNLFLKDTHINNYYVVLNKDKKHLLRKIKENTFIKVNYISDLPLEPKDSRQSSFLHCLAETEVPLVVCLGAAGTGKTSLAVAYALKEYDCNNKKLVFSKAAIPIGKGRAFGPVPGDINQKYAPYLDSFKIVLKKILGKKSDNYINFLLDKKELDYQPIEFVRGNTYENCTFILDEVQNLTWHELKTVISRMGENAKLILIGDINQSDLPFARGSESGILKLITSSEFKNSIHSSRIDLIKQYRGPLADLVYKIDNE